MQNRTFAHTFVVVVLLGFMLVARVWGYVVRTDDSGIYVIKWTSSPVTMQVKLSSVANLIDGNSQRSSIVAAMQAWNAQLGTVQLSPQLSAPGVYANGNGVSEIVMDSTIDGDAFPAGTLAITIGYSHGDSSTEDDIIFNTAYSWNSYRGDLRYGIEDIQRVAIHEMGHVLGLNHPDEHGQNVVALMNSRESNLDSLQSDDIVGGQFLYGAPGVVPPNDNFANASAVFLVNEGSLQLSGSNIAATHETGEPNHAGSTSVHSVWWKWTAPANGSLAVTTFGSNFDTVLAVYTGTSVGALTVIASNDDEDPFDANNPNAQRKRTSKVTFTAASGVIYYFAVDGWGDADGAPKGYSGSIALTLDFTLIVPPAITAQPSDATVAAGQMAAFVASISGRPLPDLKWQHRRPGANEWLDIADRLADHSSIYSIGESASADYTGTSDLNFTTDFTMDGEGFRCVATNLGGAVYSDVAVLHVTPIPLPMIVTQPQSGKFLIGVSGRISVEATDAVGYQWYRNGSPMAGQTNPLLFFPDPQPTDAGDYYVVISNPGGLVTSATATITVGPPAVITNLSPTRQIVGLGGTLSLSASASGTGALSYQWYHNGRPIGGATGVSYARQIMSDADTGAYWVAATDDMGTRYGPPFFVILSRTSTNVVAWGQNYDGVVEIPTALTDAVSLSAGSNYALALRLGGTVEAWGNTETMQTDFTNVVAVSVGSFGALVLKADGTVAAARYAANIPAGLKEAWSISSGDGFALALKTDGTVVGWGGTVPPVNGLENIVAIAAAGPSSSMALKRDGTLLLLRQTEIFPAEGSQNQNIVAIAGSGVETVSLKADGTITWNYVPPADTDLVAIAAGEAHALALKANGTVVAWDGSNQYGELNIPTGLGSVFAIAAGDFSSFAIRDISTPQPLLLTSQPITQTVLVGRSATFFANAANGTLAPPTFQWQCNGQDIPGATTRSFTIADVEPADTGVYTTIVNGSTRIASSPAILSAMTVFDKLAGAASEVGSNILHPNGNIFDQVLLTGAAEAITADPGQVTRTSYIDLNDDIVQVEFSGAGTLSLVLDKPTGPALPVNYNQAVNYMKGHAGIVIAGANETTNVSVFTVGRATAFDPTAAYNILLPPGTTNDPAKNGSPLFAGHSATVYDGVADIAFIAILSYEGRFGGVRLANAHFFASRGLTGLYAPGVQFNGPVYIGNIDAFDAAKPVLVVGSVSDARITGGDLAQDNGQPVQVSGLTQLKFTAGGDSGGNTLPAQANRAVLQQDGQDVTSQIVVNPSP